MFVGSDWSKKLTTFQQAQVEFHSLKWAPPNHLHTTSFYWDLTVLLIYILVCFVSIFNRLQNACIFLNFLMILSFAVKKLKDVSLYFVYFS